MSLIDLHDVRLTRQEIGRISIADGTSVGVVGPIDSGKTALLLAFLGQRISGIHFERSTDLSLKDIGFVPSNPTLLFSSIKSNLVGELQLSSQFIGRQPANLDEIIDRFQIRDFLTRDPYSLSGGEMMRAAVAIIAAKRPRVWLLDQIYDWLAPQVVDQFREIMKSELALGNAIIETHSSSPSWSDEFETMVFLDEGREAVVGSYSAIASNVRNENLLTENSRLCVRLERDLNLNIQNHADLNVIVDALKPLVLHCRRRPNEIDDGPIILEAQDLGFRYPGNGFAIGPICLSLKRGEVVAIAGANGSGKTTFLQCLANLLRPQQGKLEIEGSQPTKRQWLWPRKAFYCFQNPDDQLYLPSVAQEIERTLDLLGRDRPADISDRYDRFGLTPYLTREPYHLARPIRRVVCLAAGFIASSPVVLLDEPTSGLDVRAKAAIACEVQRMSALGFTFLIVSHDFSFIAEVANRALIFSQGKVIANTGLVPWPLDHQPPIVRIGAALEIDVCRYRDLTGAVAGC
jgi:energy-coupling factor transport system ATP-binding protein